MEQDQTPIRISRFTAKKLFGVFDHTISLSRSSERITILHGPNGVGKTTMLRLIQSVAELRLEYLARTPFEWVELGFRPSGRLRVTKHLRTLKFEHFRTQRNKTPLHTQQFDLAEHERWLHRVPWLERIGPTDWLDERENEVITSDEAWLRYSGYLGPRSEAQNRPEPWLLDLRQRLAVHLVETQRLTGWDVRALRRSRARKGRGSEEQSRASRVENLATDLSNKITQAMRQASAVAASSDRTFAKKLLKAPFPRTATVENIQSTYTEQQRLRSRLMRAGLLKEDEIVDLPETDKMEQSVRKVLWFHLQDVQARLDVYRPLLEQVELFREILDGKRFINKRLVLSARDGFYFVPTEDPNARLPLSALSSGEQHEVILTYELIFTSIDNQLVLIDEPELSLHVSWQREFLDDMSRIAALSDVDIIVATHSPILVGERTDLMVALDGDGQ